MISSRGSNDEDSKSPAVLTEESADKVSEVSSETSAPARGLGVDTFLSLSAETMQVWWEAVKVLIEDDALGHSREGLQSLLSRLSEQGFTAENLTLDDVEELVDGDLESDSEKSQDDESESSLLSSVASGVSGVLLPSAVKMVLSVGSGLFTVLKGAIWALVLYGGFKLVRRLGSKRLTLANGEEIQLQWEYELEPSASESVPLTVTPSGRTLRVTSKELSGAEVLYERLTGTKAISGALSSGYFRSTGKVHGGWDLRTPNKTPLQWPMDSEGVVTRINETPRGGKQVFVRSGGYEWGFAHLSDNNVVSVGTVLRRGDVFAVSGASGTSASGGSYAAHTHVNVASLDVVGSSFASDTERRLSHEHIEDVLEAGGVSIPAVSNATSSEVPTTAGSVGVSTTVFGSDLSRRTNNPYSIMQRSGSASWEGSTGVENLSGGRRIVKFDNVRSASRAAALTLLKYQKERDLSRTGGSSLRLRDIASTWVDGNYSGKGTLSSDALRWARGIASRMGVSIDTPIDVSDPDVMVDLLQGVGKVESGTSVSRSAARTGTYSAFRTYFDGGHNDQGGRALAPNVQR